MGKFTYKFKKVIVFLGGKLYKFAYEFKLRLNHCYYHAILNGIEKKLIISGRLYCLYPQKLKIGKHCCFNDGVIMHCGGGIVMGNNVTISTDAKIITRSYDTSNWIEQCWVNEPDKKHIAEEIYLGDHTWVGASAIILPGVRITGKGVIIAGGSVVTKSCEEDYVVLGGNPAKVIKRFSSQQIIDNN